jgi:hypothetical protein
MYTEIQAGVLHDVLPILREEPAADQRHPLAAGNQPGVHFRNHHLCQKVSG